MFSVLTQADRELLELINGWSSPTADAVMLFLSYKWTWLPFYALLLYGLWRHYRLKVIPVLLAVTVTVVGADQIASGIFKPAFERIRPCHNPELSSNLHLVEACGGLWGFVSSHAANTFGVALLLFLLLRRRYPKLVWLFVWPALVGYSRVYLAAHYPLDVIGGYIVGGACAVFAYRLYLSTAGRLKLLKAEDLRLKARGWA